MALSYYLEISANITPEEALDELASLLPELEWSENRHLLCGPTIIINATKAVGPDVTESAFKFTPTLTVGFRFVYETDYDRFKELMLQITMFLLEHAQDAVLLFNGETIVLQRLGGRLAFNSDYEIWDEAWLKSRVKTAFEFSSLPSPLL